MDKPVLMKFGFEEFYRKYFGLVRLRLDWTILMSTVHNKINAFLGAYLSKTANDISLEQGMFRNTQGHGHSNTLGCIDCVTLWETNH
jgi:hypothetical protein